MVQYFTTINKRKFQEKFRRAWSGSSSNFSWWLFLQEKKKGTRSINRLIQLNWPQWFRFLFLCPGLPYPWIHNPNKSHNQPCPCHFFSQEKSFLVGRNTRYNCKSTSHALRGLFWQFGSECGGDTLHHEMNLSASWDLYFLIKPSNATSWRRRQRMIHALHAWT